MKPLSIFNTIAALALLPCMPGAKDSAPPIDSTLRPEKAITAPPFSNYWSSESWEPASEKNFWRKQTDTSKKTAKSATADVSKTVEKQSE